MSATNAHNAGAGYSTHNVNEQMNEERVAQSDTVDLSGTNTAVDEDGRPPEKRPLAVKQDLEGASTEDVGTTAGSGAQPQGSIETDKEESKGRTPAEISSLGNDKSMPAATSTEGAGLATNVKDDTDRPDLSLSIRDKPRISSPPPPVPPPKDATIQSRAAGKQPEYQEYDEKHPPEDDSVVDQQPGDNESQSEIQSIMEQFGEDGQGLGKEEILSPRMEIASPVFFPPRGSSLEPESQSSPTSPSLRRPASRDSYNFNPSRARPPSIGEGLPPPPPPASEKPDALPPQSPGGNSLFQPPPPSPDPEPALPFDFHRFLEQLRHRTADPVARFLRSFLNEFGKKQWQVHEQVKIISDFLEFISKKMSQCEVWRTVSDAEFDNAREGMEKLVMNRLYSQTFSPAIPPVESTGARTRRARANAASVNGPGRRGQHQEDVERDDVITQKIRIYGWIKEEHLDIPSVGDKGRKFLSLAQQELLKINSYRAPRDKVIQILNCCKVIFGFLKNNKTDQSADSFVPLLIYTVLKANPSHLVSNVQYILRFRNQDKLGGEAGYYISSLMGVISFIENLDRTNLTISNEDFEANVEAAVSAIAEGHKAEEYESRTSLDPSSSSTPPLAPPAAGLSGPDTSPLLPHLSEKSAPARPEVTPRNSMDAERASPRRVASKRLGSSEGSTSNSEDLASGLLRTIQKPLSGIGRMFSDEAPPPQPPRPGTQRSPTRSGAGYPGEKRGEESEVMRMFAGNRTRSQREQPRRSHEGQGLHGVPAGPGGRETEEAIRQASKAEAEASRIRTEEHRVVVETLQGMFPDLDKDVISDVVRMKEGRVGMAVDACLALSAS
ncbi:VPS9a-like protein [Elsinoe fawcettii]|nr:VPS9a-like protein [Elsinoe fawcettii]